MLFEAIASFTIAPRFGFVQGHFHLDRHERRQIRSLVGKYSPDAISNFENKYSSLIGAGSCVSFASARMCFFALMEHLGVGEGDEVILPGATCSVMANAVLRTGARPVYADIDPQTLGSSVKHIESCISQTTRVIIAQHSFGIPCNIEPIVELARSKNIFLLEDCALTLGSKIIGRNVGTFGDAAIFSTDHSKPINTLVGGIIYSEQDFLISSLYATQKQCDELSVTKQKALWKRLRFEARYCRPERYGQIKVGEIINLVIKKIFRRSDPFLSGDCGPISVGSYPYPARLPSFLGALGLVELQRWDEVERQRRDLLGTVLTLIGNGPLSVQLPSAYYDPDREIVPLRLAWSSAPQSKLGDYLSKFIDLKWTWFMQPIVTATEPLGSYGYRWGSCPVSEDLGPRMVNVPCNLSTKGAERLLASLSKAIRSSSPSGRDPIGGCVG